MTSFWKMQQPDYITDHQEKSINGYVEHPYGLPGVECTDCGETWSSTKILPYKLPSNLNDISDLNTTGVVSDSRQIELQAAILEKLENYNGDRLLPGYEFQPVYLDIPSEPRADFLWASFASVLISDRIRDIFVENDINGVVFSPVYKRKIGKRKIKYPFKVSNESCNYSELIITSESKSPPGAEVISICERCGREDINDETRKLVMVPEMWCGDDIFFLKTTLWIIVTDKVKSLIESVNATNVYFEKL
ncbi:double-CXXCG motif protein [Neobacillus drentensis]|uniref:double-CXXCG motif protein n=1 Tax=Neobacillus drentensis TaxID=220684 RepID=UPI002FFF5A07